MCEVNEITPIVTEINITEGLEIEKIKEKQEKFIPPKPIMASENSRCYRIYPTNCKWVR